MCQVPAGCILPESGASGAQKYTPDARIEAPEAVLHNYLEYVHLLLSITIKSEFHPAGASLRQLYGDPAGWRHLICQNEK